MIRTPADMPVEERPQMRGGAGTVRVQTCFRPEEFGARLRLCARLTLPPGASIGLHAHEGEDEIYLVLTGGGVVTEDGCDKRVRAGDAVLTGRGGSHAVRNDGSEPLEIAAIIVKYA